MDFQNEQRQDPLIVEDLNMLRKDGADELCQMVDKLHSFMSLEKENPPSRVARSKGQEANDSLQRILPNLPLPRVTADGTILKLRNHSRLVNERLKMLLFLRIKVRSEISKHITPLNRILQRVEKERYIPHLSKGIKRDIEDIGRKIFGLVGELPSLPEKQRRHEALHSEYDGDNICSRILNLPGFHENEDDLTKLEAYRQLEQKFMELAIEQRICLLSFAVFPENKEVHRTMLMYWWIGEGILPVEGAEEAVKQVLKEFTEKKLVEPVDERRKVAPSSYKMTAFVHSSVIYLSKKVGLFDIYHKGKKPSMNNSKMGKVCLVEGSSKQTEAGPRKMRSVDQIGTVFNVSERYPEFTFKWFSEHPSDRKIIKLSKTFYKSLHVFHLGRWERTQKRHVQVRNPELMKCFKRMKNLRLLSFQGISTIRSLKGSVCKLHKLIVLDLRECSDLTRLPEKIDTLQSLVYLDMTGCYMLEWIPMRLNLLKNLEVLKGFVVSDTIYERVACTLSLLKRLQKLRKLSIEIHRDDLGIYQVMEELVKLKALTSLKVTWRRDLNTVCAGKIEISLPDQLKKLDLQRFPHEQLPTWLQPQNLLHLKNLHIRGARTLKGFGDLPKKETECAVEVLRLTFLPKLRIGWIELKQLYFPKLIFLEKYECPRVTLTPCDEIGIWRSDQDD